jgi:hypothetical protein
MPLTAEQHAAIATSYDKAAADLFIPAERRAEFANKANWFRHLAALEAKRESVAQVPNPSLGHAVGPAQKDIRNFRTFKHLLATLWLTGAVVYLISTLLFTNVVGLFGEDDQAGLNSKQASPLPEPMEPKVPTADPLMVPSPGTLTSVTATAGRPHAISPNQPSSEPPPRNETPETTSMASPSAVAEPPTTATLKLKSTANIRSGPSTSAKIIGTAAVGSELRVTAREADWVQFIDPSSGNTGWIHAALVEPLESADALLTATKPAKEQPQVEAVKPNSSKPSKQSAKNPVVSKRPPPIDRSPGTYVELPPDEDFLPVRKRGRPGIFERRRMLREGLMTPGFLPPR